MRGARVKRTRPLRHFALILWLGLAACGPEESAEEAASTLTAPAPAQGATMVADPYRARFPENSVADNFARTIWDMHVYQGRIYLGAGDFWNNRGQTAVWSVGDDGATADTRLETVVDEEMVERFVTIGDTLYIPGKDATEGWEYGNFYTKRAGVWEKHRTIPNGVHVLDLAGFGGQLFVNMRDANHGAVLASDDGGATWRPLPGGKVAGALIPTAAELLVFGYNNRLWGYSEAGLKEYRGAKLAPRTAADAPMRLATFADGVLYIATFLPWFDSPSPLLYLRRPYRGYVALDRLAGEAVPNVRDVQVDEGVAYVLAAKRSAAGTTPAYVGQVFSSPDAVTWRKEAEFTVPAPPYSLARMNGRFYVGLGNEGFYTTDTTLEPASGTIWRLD